MKTLPRQTETVRILYHSCQSRIKTKLSVVEDAMKPSRRMQESVLTLPSLLLLLLLCQRGLVHDLRGGRLRFLRGDEPRRSSAIHRQEDESAHSVSSSSQHQKNHLLLLLWFSVCRDSTSSRPTVALT